jgi:hypothetical protein
MGVDKDWFDCHPVLMVRVLSGIESFTCGALVASLDVFISVRLATRHRLAKQELCGMLRKEGCDITCHKHVVESSIENMF